jgi:succinoglycan biosynthesis transport protein ExoP
VKADANASGDALSLLDYVATIKRRRVVVLLALVLVPAAAIAVSLFQHPVYRGTAKVLVSQQNLAQTVAGVPDPAATQDPLRTLQTQADLAHITAIADRLRRAVGTTMTVPQILRACSVTPKTNSNLLVFSCESGDASLARRLATGYAQQYTLYRHQLDTGSLRSARRDILAQVAKLDGTTSAVEAAERAALLEKAQQLQTLESLQASNVAVVQVAAAATQISPRPVRNGMLGVLLGGVLGIGLVFLLEALDTRVQSTEEVERLLGLPLLARIPAPPRRLQQLGQLVMSADPNGPHAEPFRVLRTNLDFFNLQTGARTIMVTSAVEQEGKSTTIANLALALSRAGHRVVLVDLDLRRPTLARTFGVEGAVGFTDIAYGRAKLEPAEPDDGSPESRSRLDILTTGSLPADTGDFIEGEALPRVLRQLREQADIVLIDSPPVLPVGDALSLAAKVDAIIVLSRLGVARRPMLKELRRMLDAVPAAKLGVVVTGAELDQGYPHAYGGYYRNYESAPEGQR